MKFSLVVYAPPSRAGSRSALRFVEALLRQGHQLYRVFFYGDGCRHGFSEQLTDQGSREAWSMVIAEHKLDAVICVTAAVKRNLLTEADARVSKPGNLLEGFELSGLGQLIDAAACSDRVVTFR